MKAETPKINLARVNKYGNVLFWLLPAVTALITFLCYNYSLGNEFTNWDDQRFIPQNIFIKSFSAANLKMMLFHDVTGDYYNPLTILSYAFNYHFSGIAPQSYYFTNILIHILNSCFVFFFTLMILKAMEHCGYGNFKWKNWLAFFCALAFAIHPMHVESVSWIAERKDVLYAFFYFAGLISYIQFLRVKTKKYVWFVLTFACFLLSLLSKPMAIVFPLSLFAIDILLKRDQTISVKNIVLEKLPFICVGLLSAIITYHLQKLSGSIQDQRTYSFFQRFLFACYGFYMYIFKAFIPIPQSSFYPYPELSASGNLPFIFYLSLLIALLMAAIPLYVAYPVRMVQPGGRSGKNNFRIVLFGLVFYFFNMVIVSQIIASGPTMMADRYTYVCYFGIFFPLTYFIYKILQKSEWLRKITTAVISAYILFFSILCYQRTLVWHNSETLWSDVIKKYPHQIVKAYNNLGDYYFEHADLDDAYNNYKEAINLKTGDPQVYCNMGSLLGAKRQFKLSLQYYGVSLKIDSNDGTTYLDRAITYSAMGRYDLAIPDYRRSSRLNPYSELLLCNIAYTYLNAHQFDSAISYYNRAIQINPNNPGYFHYRGVAEYDKGDINPAINDFMQNLRMAPHDSECMFYISITYNRISDFNSAYKYVQMAQNAQYRVPDDYVRLLKARLNVK